MKYLYHFAAAALLAASLPASAALPPQYQRTAELKAILDHADVVGAFKGRPIDRVEWVSADLYRVSAGGCMMEVAIVGKPLPPGMVGARRFEVVPGELVCTE